MNTTKNNNQDSSKKQSGFDKFKRKVLGMDRPLTYKEKMAAKVAGDEFYLKSTKPPKGYAMSQKTFEERQAAKRRVSSYKAHLNKK